MALHASRHLCRLVAGERDGPECRAQRPPQLLYVSRCRRLACRRACVGLRPCVHHRGPRRRRRPAPGPPQPPRCREAHDRQRLQPPRAVVRPPAFRLVVCGPRGLAVDSAQAPLGRPLRQPCALAARDRAVGSGRRGPVARPRPGPLRHLHHLPRVGQQPARHIPSPLCGHGQHCCGPAPPVWRSHTARSGGRLGRCGPIIIVLSENSHGPAGWLCGCRRASASMVRACPGGAARRPWPPARHTTARQTAS